MLGIAGPGALEQVLEGGVAEDAALAQQQEAVAAHGLVHDVARDQDGAAARREAAEERESLIVDVGGFEGPLDLLLHLVKKQEVDIYQVNLARRLDRPAPDLAALPFQLKDRQQC